MFLRRGVTTRVNVRLAAASDAVEIAAISRDYIERGLEWRWTYNRVLGVIADPETNVVVVGSTGGIVAFGIMSYSDDDAHLALLGVRRSAQRRGVASAILLWLEQVATLSGCARLLVEARASNIAAQGFYLSRGFHLVGTKAAMYGDAEEGVRLQKWLR